MKVIVPALTLRKFLRRGRAIARALRVNRPNRPMQMSGMGNILLKR
jgi:hypothetical protein